MCWANENLKSAVEKRQQCRVVDLSFSSCPITSRELVGQTVRCSKFAFIYLLAPKIQIFFIYTAYDILYNNKVNVESFGESCTVFIK